MTKTARLIGKNVAKYREGLGISQSELGRRAGLSHGFISLIEAGERDVSLKTLEIVSAVLEVTVNKLTKEEER